jgi:hypothetical protein
MGKYRHGERTKAAIAERQKFSAPRISFYSSPAPAWSFNSSNGTKSRLPALWCVGDTTADGTATAVDVQAWGYQQ